MVKLEELILQILQKRGTLQDHRSLLVGISGIDGSGKGYVTKQIVDELQRSGNNAVAIHVDGWLNLPSVRFSHHKPAEHFYAHAIRFDEMFSRFVLPLVRDGFIDLDMDFVEETAIRYKTRRFKHTGMDIVVLEGIFLFKKDFQHYYDVTVWIDCTFETALQRAIDRSQEGLSAENTIGVYNRIYFPAQRIHFSVDDPRSLADFIYPNDPNLGS